MGMAFWGFAAGHRDHMCSVFTGKFWPGPWSGLFIERSKACLDQSFASPRNRGHPPVESGSNLVIRKSVGRFQQDSCPGDLATEVVTTSKKLEPWRSLIR
jgi:hypothetical protein